MPSSCATHAARPLLFQRIDPEFGSIENFNAFPSEGEMTDLWRTLPELKVVTL